MPGDNDADPAALGHWLWLLSMHAPDGCGTWGCVQLAKQVLTNAPAAMLRPFVSHCTVQRVHFCCSAALLYHFVRVVESSLVIALTSMAEMLRMCRSYVGTCLNRGGGHRDEQCWLISHAALWH